METSVPPGLSTSQERSCARDKVEHQIDRIDDLFETLVLVVDRLIGSELTHENHVLGGNGCRDERARGLGELDRQMADAAGAAMDENPLPGFEAAMVEQALPCSDAGKRHRRGFDMAETIRFRSRLRRLDHDIFGIAAPVMTKHRKQRVALLQRMRPRAAYFHRAGHVAP